MSQRKARPKLVAPPPPISHARQPTRFTASVTLFTADPGAHACTQTNTRHAHRHPAHAETREHPDMDTHTPIIQQTHNQTHGNSIMHREGDTHKHT